MMEEQIALACRCHEERMFEALGLGRQPQRQWAHDLRSRLMPMLTLAQMLKKPEGLDAEALAWAGQSLEKKILELAEMAAALLAEAKAAGDGGTSAQESFDFKALTCQLLQALPAWPGTGQPSIDLPAGECRVLGRAVRLRDPLARCLLSAAGLPGPTFIELRAEAKSALLSINTRPAALPAAQPSLGLGLQMARMLIEQEGGEIHFEPLAQAGAFEKIVVRLPLAGPEPLAD